MLKEGSRVAAFATGPIRGSGYEKVILVCVIERDGIIEGILSDFVRPGGSEAAKVIARMVNRSRLKEQIRLIVTNGIALAGLNLIDPEWVEKKTGKRLLMITRKRPNARHMANAIRSAYIASEAKERLRIIQDKRLVVRKAEGFFVCGLADPADIGNEMTRKAVETLRAAHLIARGISTGESKGRI
jgi:Uncharacterized conserved protein